MLQAAQMLRFCTLFASALVLSSLFAAGQASAQTVAVANKQSLRRINPDGSEAKKRLVNPEAFNYADCLANQSLDITYTTTAPDANKTLEVWAGQQDCKPIAARSGTTQQCWKVAPNLTAALTGNVKIPIRNIVNRRTGTDVVDSSGNAAVCNGIALSTFSLYFMWFQGTGTDPVGTPDQVDIQVKTLGPSALTGLSVAPGNTRLIVTFSAVGEAGVADQQGIRVYCDDKPTSTTTTTKEVTVCNDAAAATPEDAGDGEATDAAPVDAGCTTTTETVSGGAACSSVALTPAAADSGLPTLPDEKYLCAEIGGNTGARVVVENINGLPLVNDKTYAVAVAAVDSFGNVGSLADPTCATPGATTDFWQLYRDSGGQAGGCSSESAPIGGLFSAIPVLGALLAVVRRRVARRSGK